MSPRSDASTPREGATAGAAAEPTPVAKLAAEAVGTFVLVLGGCGAAVLAAATTTTDGTEVGIGYLGVSLAFGLTVLVMAATFGAVSGGHFNPAVSLGLAVAGRLPWRDLPGYVVAQVVGAVAAAGTLFVVASGRPGFDASVSGFATNGYGDRSPAGYSMLAALVAEVVLTAVFLLVILGATAPRAPKALAPVAIGLALTLIHLVAIPVTNTSVNPARSLGPALFAGGAALEQLWLFVLAPLVGAVLAALVHVGVFGRGERTR